VLRASAEELRQHELRLAAIRKTSGGVCLWDEGDGG
jgi:hypothetical protein